MLLCRVCVCLVGIATAGCSDSTRLRLEIGAPGAGVTTLRLSLAWDGKTQLDTPLPKDGSAPRLPGSVLLVLPDVTRTVDVTVEADGSAGPLTQRTAVEVRAHDEVQLALMLMPQADMPLADLSTSTDLAAADLATADLALADLAGVAVDAAADLFTPDLAPHNPLVQIGSVATGGATLTANLPAPSRAGTVLILSVVFDKGTDPNGPGGWAWWAGDSSANNATMFYLLNNPGNVTSASAMVAGAGASIGQLSEWDTVTAVDQGNWCWNSNQVTSVVCTTNPTTHPQDLAISVASELLGSAAAATLSSGNGFSTLGQNDAASSKLHYRFGYALAVPSAAPVTETVASGTAGTWAATLVTFH